MDWLETEFDRLKLTMKWYPVLNDLVGGWAVSPFNKPLSQHNHEGGEIEVADFTTQGIAEHIAKLHNDWLETLDECTKGLSNSEPPIVIGYNGSNDCIVDEQRCTSSATMIDFFMKTGKKRIEEYLKSHPELIALGPIYQYQKPLLVEEPGYFQEGVWVVTKVWVKRN